MVLISEDKFEEEEVEVEVEVPGLDPVVVVVGEEGEVEVVGEEKVGEGEVAVEEVVDGVVVCVCGLKGSHGINLTFTFNVPVRFYK